jgi:predicted small metal-binding protein
MKAAKRATDLGQQLLVRCDCGFEVRGSANVVVERMQDHARNVHNMTATREQVLGRATSV